MRVIRRNAACSTGKSLSEALIFASNNPQYDNKLFIVHENCKLRIPAEHVLYTNCCFCFTFRTILEHNMLRASEKDLPVQVMFFDIDPLFLQLTGFICL